MSGGSRSPEEGWNRDKTRSSKIEKEGSAEGKRANQRAEKERGVREIRSKL